MLKWLTKRCFGKRSFKGTTVLSVRKDKKLAMIGDGQVCFGHTKFKTNAVKIHKISPNILCGYAGNTADCFALLELLEKEYEKYPRETVRVCMSLARQWRTNKMTRNFNCEMIVSDPLVTVLLNGQGDAVEMEGGVVAIGSGGLYAQSAAKALIDIPGLSAKDVAHKAMSIAAELCIFTNQNFSIEEVDI